jgi:hypothetical protein
MLDVFLAFGLAVNSQTVAAGFPDDANGPATKTEIPTLKIGPELLAKAKLGNRKAGMFCLPAGAVSKDDIQLEQQAQQVLDNHVIEQIDILPDIKQVAILDVKVSLCGKTYLPYGVGVVNGYTGTFVTVLHLYGQDRTIQCPSSETKFKESDAMPILWSAAFTSALKDCIKSK